MIKIALSMIVAPTDIEAQYLEKCLENVHEYVDGIFITITGKNKKVEEIAREYNAVISFYDWDSNFGKARKFNFSQVPKEFDYILWADADDIFRGLDKLKESIEKELADAYLMFYLYAFDEFRQPIVVHPKTMVIKNDGCLEWDDSSYLHEDFKENRKVKNIFIKGIERIHTATQIKFDNAKNRNVSVAKRHVKELPNDPRSHWNLANSYKACGEEKKALKEFEIFMNTSLSEDEKYIAYIRMAESYFNLGNKIKALDSLKYAIGTKPEFPDAYNQIGAFYLDMKQYSKAIEYLKIGLNKKPPYFSIVVYNPRDYDYVPMMNLAKAYFAMSLPTLAYELLKKCLEVYPQDKKLKDLVALIKKENDKFEGVAKIYEELKEETDIYKIKTRLESLSDDWQAHPVICNLRNTKLIKNESSGKDVVYYCGHTNEVWTPKTAEEKGIGGSEEAVINLSRELVKKGWNVTVFNNCGYKPLEFEGVKYKPYWSYNYRDKQDVTILWRSPAMCDYDINSDKVVVDLHDVIQEGEFTEKRLNKIDKIFVKSNFHRSLFPKINDDKFYIIPNGINVDEFNLQYERDPYLMINTSSPDRGLRGLVDMFKEIKKEIPEVKLKWAYGWNVFDTVHGDNIKMIEWKNKLVKDMEELGIENLGRLSHPEVNKLYQQAAIFAYPSEFAEIDCISLTKAFAGGAYPVSVDFSAHGEKKVLGGTFINSNKNKDNWCKPYQTDFSITDEEQKRQYIKETVEYLKSKKEVDKNISKKTKELYSWDNISNIWNNNLTTLLKELI